MTSRAVACLLLHDPEYRKVRREHLVETGRRIESGARLRATVTSVARVSVANDTR